MYIPVTAPESIKQSTRSNDAQVLVHSTTILLSLWLGKP